MQNINWWSLNEKKGRWFDNDDDDVVIYRTRCVSEGICYDETTGDAANNIQIRIELKPKSNLSKRIMKKFNAIRQQ